MSEYFSVGQSIASCQQHSPVNALETRMLLSHVCGLNRVQLITCSEQALDAEQAKRLNQMLSQRLVGHPMAYLLAEREFFGLMFKVTPDVLIPRPDTELLVELALQHTPEQGCLLDLGTGSGAIAIAIAAHKKDCVVHALDISPAALSVAQENARRLLSDTAKIHFTQSDWYQHAARIKFNTIVSNPPYIVENDPHLSQGDLRFEPINALTDHADGLSAYRTIISNAPNYLSEDGWLLMEHGYDQSEAVQHLLRIRGFSAVQSWQDLAGIWRVSGGQWID